MQIVDPLRIMLDVKVDKGVERERIGKEIARVKSEIDEANARLAKETFVARAPPAVVEQVRTRLAGSVATLQKLEDLLARLKN